LRRKRFILADAEQTNLIFVADLRFAEQKKCLRLPALLNHLHGQSVIRVALKTPLETRLGICMYKTSLLHRPIDYIGFTPSCPPHILQQNCAHVHIELFPGLLPNLAETCNMLRVLRLPKNLNNFLL